MWGLRRAACGLAAQSGSVTSRRRRLVSELVPVCPDPDPARPRHPASGPGLACTGSRSAGLLTYLREYAIVWQPRGAGHGGETESGRAAAGWIGEGRRGVGVSLGAGVPEPGLQRGPKSLLPAERGLGMSSGATRVGWGGESCRLLSTPRSTPTSTALCGRPPCLHRPPVFSVGSCVGSCSTAPLAAGAPAGGGGRPRDCACSRAGRAGG